jgi:hypothetical protein
MVCRPYFGGGPKAGAALIRHLNRGSVENPRKGDEILVPRKKLPRVAQ